mgnify:CR=1 FL=1
MKYEIEILSNSDTIPYNLLLLADETMEAIEKYIHQCTIVVIRSSESNHPIGVMALYEISKNLLEIKNLAIDTPFQKQGIGKQLIDYAFTLGKEKGYKKLIVGTGDYSMDAFAFYSRIGFKPYGVRANFYIDNYKAPIIENGHQLKDMIMLKQCIH